MTTKTTPLSTAAGQAEARPGRLRKAVAVLLVLVLLLGGVVWYLVRPAPDPEPVAGEVVALEAVQVNLAAGHYLRLGIALQLTEQAHEVDGSRALDAAISIFSGLEISKVTTTPQREALRADLTERLDLAYDGDVMGVYFTEFVTQ